MSRANRIIPIIITLSLAACGGGGDAASSAVATTGGKSCPLSLDEQRRAVAAFSAMMPAIAHPRCANCHGGIDVFAPSAEETHGGKQIEETTEVDSSDFKAGLGPVRVEHRKDFSVCQDCHEVATWAQPKPEMAFAGRSPVQICQQFKRTRDPYAFKQHVMHDALVLAGFEGKRGQSDLEPEPPPITHAAFQKAALAWMRLVSEQDNWKGGTSECGCVVDAPRLRITEHVRQASDRYGVERDFTYIADVMLDSTGDFHGTGTYSGTVETFKLNCHNTAPDERKTQPVQGQLTAYATESDVGGTQFVNYNLTTTDWPVELTIFGLMGSGPDGAPTADDIETAHQMGGVSQLLLKLTGPKTVIHKHTVDQGAQDHMSGCVKWVSHDDDITIEQLGHRAG